MSVLDKVLIMLGVREEHELDEESVEQLNDVPEIVRPQPTARERREDRQARRSNLVSLEGAVKQTKVMIIEPTAFEEVRTYVDHLRSKHPLIIRLDNLDMDEARRIVDFMSGATYAVDGNMRKLGDKIFFFAPHSVVIEGEIETSVFELERYES
ncbi:MAG: cell division protein SepF [Firmicutes bacterium]|nr:cell division protein SepF [Bacillota bacterium]